MAITKKVALVHDKAYAGMVADLQLANRVSRFNATSAVIPFGTAVQADTDAGSMKPIASGGTAIGVLVRELVDVTNPGSEQGVNVGKTGTVLTDGVIWVKAYEAVTVGGNVFAGVGATVKGYFCAAAARQALKLFRSLELSTLTRLLRRVIWFASRLRLGVD